MNFKQLIDKLDAETYQKLKISLETGRWPDGRQLTDEQKALTMQAIIGWEIEHDVPQDQRTGFVNTAGSSCHDNDAGETGNNAGAGDTATPLKWQ